MTRTNWIHIATLIRQNVASPQEREALGRAIAADFRVVDENLPVRFMDEQEEKFVQACIKE